MRHHFLAADKHGNVLAPNATLSVLLDHYNADGNLSI
jgi:hypothetical protein